MLEGRCPAVSLKWIERGLRARPGGGSRVRSFEDQQPVSTVEPREKVEPQLFADRARCFQDADVFVRRFTQ